MAKNLFYIVEADFARPNACTNRVLNNVKAIISHYDWHVTIIGYGDVPEIHGDTSFKNVKIGKTFLVKLFYFVFRGVLVTKLLKKQSEKADVLIYYGSSSRFLFPLLQYARRNKIKIMADVVEWYDYSHLPLGRFGLVAFDIHLGMTKFIPRCDGAIVISTFLESYFTSKNLKTIRIPVLIDTRSTFYREDHVDSFDKKQLHLIYAGIPGRKDYVLNVIKAVEQLAKSGVSIQFHLLGPSKSDLGFYPKDIFSDAIVFHGKILQHLVPKYLEQADFSILLRPNKRYSQAGFPTKFVESLNAGLPVIANLTSDLNFYLNDGYNGIVVNAISVDALTEKIKGILLMDKNELLMMKKNARKTAIDQFDYRIYSGILQNFLTNI
jgi:glycosyltransferase involved in cell wall biosynthesis